MRARDSGRGGDSRSRLVGVLDATHTRPDPSLSLSPRRDSPRWGSQAVHVISNSDPTIVGHWVSPSLFPLRAGTFDHLLQMLPEDVTHEVRCQLQEALLAQVTQHLAVHAEPLEIDVHQTELVGGPQEPLADLLLRPQPGVCGGRRKRRSAWGGDTEEGGREAGGTPGLSASSTRAPKTNETRETPQVKSATLSTVLEVRVQLAGLEPKLAPGNQVSAPLGVTPDAKAYRSSAARLQASAGWQERPAAGTHSWGCPGGAAPSGSR